jgi:ketosteroid isomerase-like protein
VSAVDDFDEVIEQWHLAQGEFLKGNPEPVKERWSHREDVSVANPYGPPVRGWEQVAKTVEHAASLRSDGEFVGSEVVAKYVTAELAYVVQIERAKAKVGGREDITPYAVRATNIFRLEDGEWKVVHRHADPITTPQPAESVIQE